MIYKNFENGKLKNIIAMCDCGCSGFNFQLFDDTVFISVYGSNFYSYQNPGRLNRRAFFKKLLRKENIISDIILSKEEVKELLEALESFQFSQDDGETYQNESHLELSPLKWDDITEYELLLVYEGNLSSIIRHKTYRGFEIALKEKEFNSLIKNMKEIYEN